MMISSRSKMVMQRISTFSLLYLSVGLLFTTYAQNTPVLCYPLGSLDCFGLNVSASMSYSECCSQPGAANVYYRSNHSSSQCTLCGPVFLEEESYPAFVGGTVLIISWELHPNSIPVRRYRSRHYEVGSPPAQAIPSDFDPPIFSLKFLSLTIGVNYVFSMSARGENGGLSEELLLTWEAGKSHLPSFSDFNETIKRPLSVTAEWILNCSGVFPLKQVVIQWREGANESEIFPEENVVVLNYDNSSTPADGALIQHQFQNLTPSTAYVVRIEGRNRLGYSSSHFLIETSDEIASTVLDTGGLAPRNTDLTWKSSKRLLIILLLTSFIAIFC